MKKLPSVWIQELTWEMVAEYLKKENIAIIPAGSTEEHGPAGPLGVDAYAAIALAEDAGMHKTGPKQLPTPSVKKQRIVMVPQRCMVQSQLSLPTLLTQQP